MQKVLSEEVQCLSNYQWLSRWYSHYNLQWSGRVATKPSTCIAEKHAYWVCRKYYRNEFNAQASDPADGTFITIFKGLTESLHSHVPNIDENIADQLATSIKRKAEEHPEQPPAQLLWTELQGVPDGVLSQLPLQPALVRAMQRIHQKKALPA